MTGSVGRNDPCPCGSGKKYKKCCLDLDRQAGVAGSAAGQVRAIAAEAAEWEADIVALPGGLEDDPAARLAVLLVVAEGFVIHSQVLNRPSPEPEAMAETLAAAILETGERVGGLPEVVAVREPEVADALTRHLAQRAAVSGVARMPSVEDDDLSDVDEAAFALGEHTTGRPGRFHLSCPDTWAGWELPQDAVADLFRLAAAFYRAAPWRVLTNLDVLEATVLEGGTWTVCVLGNGGEEFGVSLYSEAEDFWCMADAEAAETAFDDLEGRILSLHLEAGGDIPRAMRREIAAAGWEVASAEAYPRIMGFNMPAGGLRRRDVDDLAALLVAVPRFVEAHGAAVEDDVAVERWRDEGTGVVLSYRPDEHEEWGVALMPLVHHLAPGCAEGPGADPQALIEGARAATDAPDALAERQTRVVERFAVHLREREGLSGNTATKHAENAATFVEFLAGFGVPMGALHEYHLRDFLFDWYPRKGRDSAARRSAMPGSLARFFDFLAEEEGIVCPWSREILADRRSIRERWQGAPRGFFWDPEVIEWRVGHHEDLYARLLLPDGQLGEDDRWGAAMGPTEAQLHGELHRRWLLWRDELLRSGMVRSRELVDRLVARQREWEAVPQPALDGRSPLQAIRDERRRREERGGPSDSAPG